MEPRSSVASFDAASGRLTVRISNQMPTAVAAGLAGALPGIAQEQVHVLVGDVGGGFGMKTGMYPGGHRRRPRGAGARPAGALAGRPQRGVPLRLGTAATSRAAPSSRSTPTARRWRCACARSPTSAPIATPAGVAIQLLIGPWVSTSIYDIAVVDLHMTAVLTNTTPTGAYRGAGRPEAIYIIERLFDAAAREMKLDPGRAAPPQHDPARADAVQEPARPDLRQRRVREDPRPGPGARRLERLRGAPRAIEGARPAARPRHRLLPRVDRRQRASRRTVSVDVTPDGIIEIFSATQAMGQGIATSYAQLAVDVFGVPIEKIRIVQGDTDRAATASAAPARARSSPAARRCGSRPSERSSTPRRSPARRSRRRPATSSTAPAASPSSAPTSASTCSRSPASSPAQRIHLEASATAGGPTWPNACHVCEVEVDPETRRRSRRRLLRRSTTSAASSARRSRAARSTAARCRASARRSASRSSTTPRAASSSPAASWTTRCRAPTSASPSGPSSTPRSRARPIRSASRASASSARSARRRR